MYETMKKTLVIFLSGLLIIGADGRNPCRSKDYGNEGTVCVCNSEYCDTIDSIGPTTPGKYIVYTSSKSGLRFEKAEGNFQRNTSDEERIRMIVDSSLTYQKIVGFGGAITDSAGYNINSLSDGARDMLIRSYFSTIGIEYNMMRVPIGGCDFSSHEYTYDDIEGDTTLTHFNLTMEDFNDKIPLIKRAKDFSNKEIKLIGSAWSAPPWMKTNNDYSGFGFLKTEYFQLWADYMIRFLDMYKQNGLSFWGLTTGNEPINGIIPINRFNSLGWTPKEQTQWIAKNLGPTLARSEHNQTKLIMLDDQRFMLPWWVNLVMRDTQARNFIDGIGVHWYWDTLYPAKALDETHVRHPDKFILATEASIGDKPWELEKVLLGSWIRGEQYMKDILEDLQHWVVGWIDWNLALNQQGGPNWAKNFVDSAIIVNESADEFYKQPMFYAVGHFSKFLAEGSIRVGLNSSDRFKYVNGVALQTPNQMNVIILHNQLDQTAQISISDDRFGFIETDLQPRSFNTLIYSIKTEAENI